MPVQPELRKESDRVPPTTRLLLLRHAETTAPHLFHGAESDVDISEAGRAATEAMAVSLANERPVAIYASALKRAQATAEILARALGLGLSTEPSLHERCMGALSGQPREEHWQAYESARSSWIAGNLDATHAGGESYAHVRDRAVPALKRIAARHEGETVLVVAHGITLRVLLTSLIDGLSPSDFGRVPIPNLALYEVEAGDGPWRIVRQPDPSTARSGARAW
jgi:broad specificity phosphatase PhoE